MFIPPAPSYDFDSVYLDPDPDPSEDEIHIFYMASVPSSYETGVRFTTNMYRSREEAIEASNMYDLEERTGKRLLLHEIKVHISQSLTILALALSLSITLSSCADGSSSPPATAQLTYDACTQYLRTLKSLAFFKTKLPPEQVLAVDESIPLMASICAYPDQATRDDLDIVRRLNVMLQDYLTAVKGGPA